VGPSDSGMLEGDNGGDTPHGGGGEAVLVMAGGDAGALKSGGGDSSLSNKIGMSMPSSGKQPGDSFVFYSAAERRSQNVSKVASNNQSSPTACSPTEPSPLSDPAAFMAHFTKAPTSPSSPVRSFSEVVSSPSKSPGPPAKNLRPRPSSLSSSTKAPVTPLKSGRSRSTEGNSGSR
jgi:hypothetical protein